MKSIICTAILVASLALLSGCGDARVAGEGAYPNTPKAGRDPNAYPRPTDPATDPEARLQSAPTPAPYEPGKGPPEIVLPEEKVLPPTPPT